MLPVGFGWSAGDIVKAIEILTVVIKAFKDAGGAASRFQEEAGFLESIMKTLLHVQDYVTRHPDDKWAVDIVQLASRLNAALESIRKSHEKYAKHLGLSRHSKMSKFRIAPTVVRYTIRDLAGDVNKRQSAIMQPLEALGTLLTLQSLEKISKTNDQPLSASNIQQLVTSFQSCPIFAQLEQAIQILNRCQHATRTLDVSAFESVLGALNTTQARTMELLRKHCDMQNRLYFDDYWRLKLQSKELEKILKGFQDSVEVLSSQTANKIDLRSRTSHRRLLMDIRFLLEEHNTNMLKASESIVRKTWRPSFPVALLVWIIVYFLSLCSSVSIALAFAFSSSSRCNYSSPIFNNPRDDKARSRPQSKAAASSNSENKDDVFYETTSMRSSKPGHVPHITKEITTRGTRVYERTYFVSSEYCDAQVILADLQFFFKDRVVVTPAREGVSNTFGFRVKTVGRQLTKSLVGDLMFDTAMWVDEQIRRNERISYQESSTYLRRMITGPTKPVQAGPEFEEDPRRPEEHGTKGHVLKAQDDANFHFRPAQHDQGQSYDGQFDPYLMYDNPLVNVHNHVSWQQWDEHANSASESYMAHSEFHHGNTLGRGYSSYQCGALVG